MLVQMLSGVWTNSLGLISDAIHMAFDCMAIAMGLFVSVMSEWERNERFTYGYGRVETLSGFANGIFLILISVFIVFEAVQRLSVSFISLISTHINQPCRLDPPEMNTNQLLLVSSVGLGVNLFGMFAMGGHHHHVRMPSPIKLLYRLSYTRAIPIPMDMDTPTTADIDTPNLVTKIITTITRTRMITPV